MHFKDEIPMSFVKPEIVPTKSDDCDCEGGGILVCGNCAEAIDPSMMFCHECGAKINVT